jgi:hypothetical protein
LINLANLISFSNLIRSTTSGSTRIAIVCNVGGGTTDNGGGALKISEAHDAQLGRMMETNPGRAAQIPSLVHSYPTQNTKKN